MIETTIRTVAGALMLLIVFAVCFTVIIENSSVGEESDDNETTR